MEYELTIQGEMVDSSDPDEPIEFIQGKGDILPSLENAIDQLAVGESKKVSLKAAEAYGEYDPEKVMEVPKTEFPEDIPLEIGLEIGITDEEGQEFAAFIEEVSVDTITLNLNHPLAGKDLDFVVKIVGIRQATPEELENGLAEPECGCGDDCGCDDHECGCEHHH